MKIVKLKDEFIELAIQNNSTFLHKNTRPYLVLIVFRSKEYLVPFRSNVKKGAYSFIFYDSVEGKGLDFRSAFELVNENIIDSYRSIPQDDYIVISENSRTIEFMFDNYMKSNKYSEFKEEMKKIQLMFD